MKSAEQGQIGAACPLCATSSEVIRRLILPAALHEILVDLFMRWVERRLVPWKGRG